jgi:hypothetical protein
MHHAHIIILVLISEAHYLQTGMQQYIGFIQMMKLIQLFQDIN